MITLEQATKIAHKRNSNYDGIYEYEDAWHFFLDDGIERVGGDTGVVVFKESGKTMSLDQYMMKDSIMTEEECKEEDFFAMLDIAKSKRDGIDRYTEYKDVYMFYGSTDTESDGGLDQPVFVMKDSFDDYNMLGLVRNNLSDAIADENIVSEGMITL